MDVMRMLKSGLDLAYLTIFLEQARRERIQELVKKEHA
jgi:hypothetical protein